MKEHNLLISQGVCGVVLALFLYIRFVADFLIDARVCLCYTFFYDKEKQENQKLGYLSGKEWIGGIFDRHEKRYRMGKFTANCSAF